MINPADLRRKLGLKQQEFWGKIGVTQSGGSRYEHGRKLPNAVKELMRLVHVENIDVTRVKREYIAIIDLLKSNYPDLHKTLEKAAKEKNSKEK